MKYLNLGCGYHYSKEKIWTNLDFVRTGEGVIPHNLLKGVPFSEKSFDLVYHSHVLEHFPKDDAIKFLHECYRVLKPGGILRIAVPDLEQIARNYLYWLERGIDEPENNIKRANYTWMTIEMYDQTVRNVSGGEMAKHLYQEQIVNEDFIYERIGEEGRAIRSRYLHRKNGNKSNNRKLKNVVKKVITNIGEVRNLFKSSVYGKIGKFRMQGEIHQWMYDRYSLTYILKLAGFTRIVVRNAFDSYADKWSSFELDGKDGITRKPDSLFMEAIK